MASSFGATSPLLRKMTEMAVDAWHEHRIPILLIVFTALVSLRIYVHLTDTGDDRDGLQVLPKLYGTNVEKARSKTGSRATGDQKDRPSHAELSHPAAKVELAKAVAAAEKPTAGPRRIKGELHKSARTPATVAPDKIQTYIFFSSLTGGTAKRVNDYAEQLNKDLAAISIAGQGQDDASGRTDMFLKPQVLDIAEIELDDYFIKPPTAEGDLRVDHFYLFLVPSYNIDSINDAFLEHLMETHHDFRIDTAPLAPLLGYSVFGIGDREGWPTEQEGFCFQAKEIDKWMAKLSGRKRAFPLGCGDIRSDLQARLTEWSEGVVDVLRFLAQTGSLGEGVRGSGDPAESDEEDVDADGDDGAGAATHENDDEVLFGNGNDTSGIQRLKLATIDDVEDLGRLLQQESGNGGTGKSRSSPTSTAAAAAPIAIDFTSYSDAKNVAGRAPVDGTKTSNALVPAPPVPAAKEMVAANSPTYKSLTKQGYAIVGSHSGVKICRWTKSALRGRGSCYKFSFYGINSHQCMETTPSLSCSNKCVFCWRHGTNPVGTTWRWVVDPPEMIFEGVQANHYAKIKNLRGVPGVRAERFAEAMRIRHCALSLVGEPIFYPHINAFLGLLHGANISSFLVCNAQHPDQLAALHHVTQLYVSIDASNRETLRRIDRPLHRDFWERFQRCLQVLREQRFRQRTVFRLTLVKGFNVEDEVQGYADLVEQALPCFIEVKGVTYCGTSTSAGVGLSMANVPFYHEVCDFVVALEHELQARGLGYGLAAEHAHSCCVLLASERFRRDGRWHTVIDYDKFFELLHAKGPEGDFAPEDYMGPATAEWATWGNGGFDPRDARVDRKGRPIPIPVSPARKYVEMGR